MVISRASYGFSGINVVKVLEGRIIRNEVSDGRHYLTHKLKVTFLSYEAL